MKYLLLGNSNAARAADLFLTKDHAQKKERRFVRCTSAMGFKLQVKLQTTFFEYKSLTLWRSGPVCPCTTQWLCQLRQGSEYPPKFTTLCRYNFMTLWAGVPLYDSLAVPITSRVGVPILSYFIDAQTINLHYYDMDRLNRVLHIKLFIDLKK